MEWFYAKVGDTFKIVENKYSFGAKCGLNHTPFNIGLDKPHIVRYALIQSPNGVEALVIGEPLVITDKWFQVAIQLAPAIATDYCPLSELLNGAVWTVIKLYNKDNYFLLNTKY